MVTNSNGQAHSHRWAFNTSLSDVVELQDNQMFQTSSPNVVSVIGQIMNISS